MFYPPKSRTHSLLTNVFVLATTAQVIDDRARDQRLIALLEKYHKSQKYIYATQLSKLLTRCHHSNTKFLGVYRNRVLVFALYKIEAERLERFLQQRFDLFLFLNHLNIKKKKSKDLWIILLIKCIGSDLDITI